MSTSETTLKAVLMGEDRSMSRTFRGAAGEAERTGKRVGGLRSSFGALLGPVGAGIAAVGAAGIGFSKLTEFVGDSVAEARESVKVGKTTTAIIKSTGGAAKVTADQVGDLAEKLSEKAGVDDEVIQTGANLLLTFKNVRNEVGKGNQVFDRATAAAVDLSAAGFGSIDSASKMLGKALNDPVKGISALSRAGVTFTAQQKDQIKTLVKSGDVLGAQKLILKEVESQVGGVAAASASMSDKVSVAWGNFKEDVGAKLLPVLDRLGQWFLSEGLPAIQRFGGWVTGRLWPALQRGYQTIMPGVRKALAILSGGVGDNQVSWKKLGDILTGKVIPFIAKLTNVYLPLWAGQIRAVIDAVKIAWRVFETWRDIMARVWGSIATGLAGMMSLWAKMLRALSHVPGFGWAKTAADKMETAAGKARSIANAINRIPDNKNVNVRIRTSGGRIRLPDGSTYNAGQRAGGGPMVRGLPYLVGENGPELLSVTDNAHVTPARQTAAVLAGRTASTGGGGGGGYTGPEVIQLLLDGKVIHEVLLRRKRQTGMALGLA